MFDGCLCSGMKALLIERERGCALAELASAIHVMRNVVIASWSEAGAALWP